MILGWQKWQSMPAWRARWQDREARLQLRRLAADIDQIRSMEPNLERLLLITEAEDLLLGAKTAAHAHLHEKQVIELRERVEDECIRSVLDQME